MFELPHVASRLFGVPLMIARAKLDVMLGVLVPRLSAGAINLPSEATAPLRGPLTSDGIAVVPVIGTLVSRSSYLTTASGLVSYNDVRDAVESAIADAAIRGVLLEIDSPGGEVGGLFDLVEQIRALKTERNKPLWAIASESALSAAYAVGSVADRLYVTRTAEVGSVGVVAVHIDESAADAQAGLAWTFVYAGERKIDGTPHRPLSAGARAAIQADVDRLYAEFCALVAANRGLAMEAVRSTEAAIYRGEQAIRAGLADRVGTLDTAIADLIFELDQGRTAARSSRFLSSNPRSPVMTTTEQPAAVTPETEVKPVAASGNPPIPVAPSPAAPDTSHQADALRAEYSEIAAIAAQAARLGVAIDAAEAMKKGVKPDALRRSVLDALATRSEASTIVAAAPQQASTGASPIVRRARERAAAGKN